MFHARLGSGKTLLVSWRLLYVKKPALKGWVSCMTTVLPPDVLMLLTLSGMSPGVYWPQLAGLSLIAAFRRSNQKTTSLASSGWPFDHLRPGLSVIVAVLFPLDILSGSAALIGL